MTNPIVLVTGSSDGIGKATATALLSQGADVIIHGRNAKKVYRVQRELEKSTGKRPDLVIGEYTDQEQIRTMASDIISNYSRLDVLINDAGTFEPTRKVTKEGVEKTFAVNYLGSFLLTHLLLPLLQKSTPSRIVTVASSAHEDVNQIDWENLPGWERYVEWDAYALSKFADITFTYVLARTLAGTGITANCLHPGVVDTKILHRSFPGMTAIPTTEGAKTSIYLATSPDVAGVSGKYFDQQRPVSSTHLTHDRSIQERLWKMAEELTGMR